MPLPRRPHMIGIDDGPFDKHTDTHVRLVAVMMEGADLVEGVATTRFPVDGAEVTAFLADWLSGLRFRDAAQGVFLGGITIAGLAVVDVADLSERLGLPVLAVNRRDPAEHRLADALTAAGIPERMQVVERCPPALAVDDHLFASAAGVSENDARALVRSARLKSQVPEPLRLAHLIARAVALGESRGRP